MNLPWVGDHRTDPYKVEKKRKKYTKPNTKPPLCNITGEWIVTGIYEDLSFPYTVSLIQIGKSVTGSGVSTDDPLNTITLDSGSVSGDAITLRLAFNTGGYVGTQVNIGKIDCVSKTMIGTWEHIGGLGLHGSWTGRMIVQ